MRAREDDEKTTIHTSSSEPCSLSIFLWNAAWYSMGGIHSTEIIVPEFLFSLMLDELL
jgi:hypothetical protein